MCALHDHRELVAGEHRVPVDAREVTRRALRVALDELGRGRKALPGLDDVVDGAPKAVKEGVPKADADALAKQLSDAGAKVEIK